MVSLLDRKNLFKAFRAVKKEILLVLAVFLVILGSSFENRIYGQNQETWVIKKSVKGEKTQNLAKLEHLREIEIVHAKAKPVAVLAKKVSSEVQPKNSSDSSSSVLSASGLVSALNTYRGRKGIAGLVQDPSLSSFAQNRASYFSSRGSMDSHAGFEDFVNNQNGFNRLGFLALGENSSFGYSLSATDLIEQAFAGHGPHDVNQLNPDWTHVGVGISGQAVDIVFGGKKL